MSNLFKIFLNELKLIRYPVYIYKAFMSSDTCLMSNENLNKIIIILPMNSLIESPIYFSF